MEQPVQQVQLAKQVPLVKPAQQVPLAKPAQLDKQEQQVIQELLVK
jgi:hypothetical protein